MALAAVREGKTLSELASMFDLHPNQITQWCKQLLESAEGVFQGSRKTNKKEEGSDGKNRPVDPGERFIESALTKAGRLSARR